MKVVKYADQVTIPYLKECIQHVYKGQPYSKNFKEKFFKVLLEDYQRKAHNLAWFLREESTGRILNYKDVSPTPTEVINDGRKQSKTLNLLLDFLEFKGVEFTPELILDNKCIYNKQTIKITKLVPTLIKEPIIIDDIKGDTPAFLKTSIDSKAAISDEGAFTFDENGVLLEFTPITEIIAKPCASIAALNTADQIANLLDRLSSASMKVSIDLADMLLASSGNATSCISITSGAHLGTLVNFRSDFVMLCFTHSPDDRFYKQGRTWLYNRMTEKGQLRTTIPFFKFQRLYGTVSTVHLNLVESFIYKRTEEHFNLPKSAFKLRPKSISSGDYNSPGSSIGYMDSKSEGPSVWHVATTDSDFRAFSETTALVFPDPINTNGDISFLRSFKELYRRQDGNKETSQQIYMVTCEITGEQEVDTACTLIDNKWYSKKGLSALLSSGKEITPIVEEVEAQSPSTEAEMPLDDYDVEDF